MSSGFTSGGSLDKPIERDDEWLKAQKELEEERARKAELQRQQGGKSLYEVLQSNKAAKQEQFEESIKLKNQFRALDDDEIDFLDSVLENKRSKEDAIKKETEAQLALFAKAQNFEESQSKSQETIITKAEDEPDWSLKNKRKRQDKENLRGIKFSKINPNQPGPQSKRESTKSIAVKEEDAKRVAPPALTKTLAAEDSQATNNKVEDEISAPKSTGLGLIAYESDDD